MKRKYSTLSFEQRLQIKKMLDKGMCKTDIAEKTGVHISTIYREINRGEINGVYTPEKSESQKQAYLSDKGRPSAFEEDPQLASYVSGLILKEHMSVERIVEHLKVDKKRTTTKTTLYRAIEHNLIPGVTKDDLKTNVTTIFNNGQIHIARWVRDVMGISDGDTLYFAIDGDKICFSKYDIKRN